MEEKEYGTEKQETTKYICPVCGYILKVHSPQKKFTCPLCGCENETFAVWLDEDSRNPE